MANQTRHKPEKVNIFPATGKKEKKEGKKGGGGGRKQKGGKGERERVGRRRSDEKDENSELKKINNASYRQTWTGNWLLPTE